jgi:hypothetical protein
MKKTAFYAFTHISINLSVLSFQRIKLLILLNGAKTLLICRLPAFFTEMLFLENHYRIEAKSIGYLG